MISTIAVGTDGSATADSALAVAFDLAERYGARVVILSAYRAKAASGSPRLPGGAADDMLWASTDAVHAERVLTLAEESAAQRGLECTSDMSDGEPGDVLVELAERHRADVLVVGNKGMHRRILGSVPNTVTHRARCSVFLVKTTGD